MKERGGGPVKEEVVELLLKRGVSLEAVAKVVHEFQRPYFPDLTLAECLESVDHVMAKRETQYAILTGVSLDMLAEQGEGLPSSLLRAVRADDPLFGLDETLALAITNLYGSVGLTVFGHLDKTKPGIIGCINGNGQGRVHTFLDDLVAGVAAAAAARLAHKYAGRKAAGAGFADDQESSPAGAKE